MAAGAVSASAVRTTLAIMLNSWSIHDNSLDEAAPNN